MSKPFSILRDQLLADLAKVKAPAQCAGIPFDKIEITRVGRDSIQIAFIHAGKPVVYQDIMLTLFQTQTLLAAGSIPVSVA